MKLFICGGHMTPALAVIEEVRNRHPDWELVFVGRDSALERESVPAEERSVMTKLGIRFLPLTTGRLSRFISWQTAKSLSKVPIGLIQALRHIHVHRPDAIVSFGGYLALPVVIAGWLWGIPSITHEQTLAPGIANRMIACLASRICVTFPQTAKKFPGRKTVITGLPIRRAIFHPASKKPFLTETRMPLLYITGGATGAVTLNELVFPIIPKLAMRFSVVHQTGKLSLPKARYVREHLPPRERLRYRPEPYLAGNAHAWLLSHAALVIGRSGANTVSELGVLRKVSILVPLPWSAGREQQMNARLLADAGAAEIIDQASASSDHLMKTITYVMEHLGKYRQAARRVSYTIARDGHLRMAQEIEWLLGV